MQTVNLCISCVHFHRNGDAAGRGASCAAFPEGVPQDILFGAFDHRRQYGEETMLFEVIPGFEDGVDFFTERAKALGIDVVEEA